MWVPYGCLMAQYSAPKMLPAVIAGRRAGGQVWGLLAPFLLFEPAVRVDCGFVPLNAFEVGAGEVGAFEVGFFDGGPDDDCRPGSC